MIMIMAGPHQPERAATTDLPNQINNVCMSSNRHSQFRPRDSRPEYPISQSLYIHVL